MQQIVLILLVLVAMLAAVFWWWTHRSTPVSSARQSKRGAESLDTLMAWTPQPTRILTAAERQAYLVLRRALPDHMILAQVPIARFLKVPTRHSYSEWLRRVGQLCVDLVVCDNTSQVVAVVELRAPDEEESERTLKRHARMDRVLQAAGVPLHVWRENQIPSAAAAREALTEGHPVDLDQHEGAASISTRPAGAVNGAGHPGADFPIINGTREQQQEPPSSTWFDDLDSGMAPLGSSSSSERPH